jgi:Uncharacterized protein family UPF0029
VVLIGPFPLLRRRYFGGIKLGAGGLVRAYGGAARDCLKQAPKRTVTPKAELDFEACPPSPWPDHFTPSSTFFEETSPLVFNVLCGACLLSWKKFPCICK